MATQDLVFKVKIDGTDREIKSLKDLKQAKKDATDAFLKGDKDAAKALAELKDKTEDLADATRSLKTDGVEPLTGSFGLFKEGLGSGDVDKFKLGLKGIGAAMSALPIFLLIEGIKLLIDNFEDIVKWFGKSKTASDLLTESLNEQKKANELLSNSINNQIKILEAQGGSEEKILALKKQLIDIKIKEAEADILIQKQKIVEIQLNDSLYETGQKLLAQQQRAVGNVAAAEAIEKSIALDKQKRIKEASEALKQDYQTIQNLRTEDQINEIKDSKKRNEEYKKYLEDKSKIKAEQDAYDKKRKEEELAAEALQEQDARKLDSQVRKEDEQLTQDELNAIKAAASAKDYEDQLAKEKKLAAEKKVLNQKYFDDSYKITKAASVATQALSDALFAGQLQNVKKGSAEELKIKKKQFEVNKALSITQAIIDGIQGAQSQLKAGPIIGPILAGLVGITAALNVKRIASQKFDGGETGSASADVGGSSISVPTPPTTVANTNVQPITTFDENGNNTSNTGTVKAIVVETDMTESQDRVKRLTRQSQFG